MIKNITFIHFLTASVVIEVSMLYLFRFTKSSKAINDWYNNLGWTAVLLDILSILIGFYIAKFIYEYLLDTNYIDNKNEFAKFMGIVLLVQILHDFLFYFFVIKPYPRLQNKVIDEFKNYAKYYQTQAVVADSMIYLITTPILYYYLKNNKDENNIFISIVSVYLMGYFLHQKPV